MHAVIALGVGMAAIAVLAVGMLLDYHSERDRVERARDAADEIRAARMREDISAMYENASIRVENSWGGDTRVTGLVVLCDGGDILRAPLNHTVPAGGSALIRNVSDPGPCP